MTTIYEPGHEDEPAHAFPSKLRVTPSLSGNVAGLSFKPDIFSSWRGADVVVSSFPNGTLYMFGGYDYSQNNATDRQPIPHFADSTNWHSCWAWTISGMMHSVEWVSSLPPMNPSCEPVQLTRKYWEGCEENPLKCPRVPPA